MPIVLPVASWSVLERAIVIVKPSRSKARSAEVAALTLADLAFDRDGLTITIARSKTDQEATGRTIGIPYGTFPETCPIVALQAWLQAAGSSHGPVFRAVDRHRRV